MAYWGLWRRGKTICWVYGATNVLEMMRVWGLSSGLLSKKLKIKIYRTIILPVVLYGCETWSLTLREERRLRVFEDSIWA